MALTDYSSQFRVFDGPLEVTTGYATRYYVASEVGCTVNIDLLTGVYTITDVADDNASAIFVAKYNGQAIYKTFTIAKSREASGPGTAKRIVLNTNNYDFLYDERNQPANEIATLTLDKFNTSAPTTWRIKKLDETLIAEGDAASLVSSGFVTGSANANQITINQTAFNNLIIANDTGAIVIEASVIDGAKTFSDRLTLFQLIQKNKVTWESISDPTGSKAQLIQTTNDAAKVSSLLGRTVDDLLARQVQTAAALAVNIGRVERTSNDKFLVEQTFRQALGVQLGDVAADLVNEKATRAGLTDALASDITDLTASLGLVEAGLTTEASARASADEAIAAQYTSLSTSLGTMSANLTAETVARTNADDAFTASLSTLTSTVGGVRADLTSEIGTRASADSALSGSLTTLTARLNNYGGTGATIEAKTNSLTTAIANESSARATLSTTLQSDYNGKFGTINSTVETAVNKVGLVENRWTLALNANGSVAGLVLANGSDNKSMFAVQADKFYVYNSSGNGTSPFYVSGGQTFINSAVIPNAAIDNAKIGSLAVGTGNIQNLAVNTLQIAGNAVTVPTGAYTAGAVMSVDDSWVDIQTVSFTSTGAPVCVFMSANIDQNSSGYSNGWSFRIMRNGSILSDSRANVIVGSNGGLPISQNIIDIPSAGAVTYTAQVNVARNNYPISRRSLVCMELKK